MIDKEKPRAVSAPLPDDLAGMSEEEIAAIREEIAKVGKRSRHRFIRNVGHSIDPAESRKERESPS